MQAKHSMIDLRKRIRTQYVYCERNVLAKMRLDVLDVHFRIDVETTMSFYISIHHLKFSKELLMVKKPELEDPMEGDKPLV